MFYHTKLSITLVITIKVNFIPSLIVYCKNIFLFTNSEQPKYFRRYLMRDKLLVLLNTITNCPIFLHKIRKL